VEREFHMRPVSCRTDVCHFGDIVAVYECGVRFFLVGIEVKDWKEKVTPALAQKYLSAYSCICEYFYLSAHKFSRSVFGMASVGLFSLARMEVIRQGKYLNPDESLRMNAIVRMKKSGLVKNVVESHHQTILEEFP